MAWLDYHTGLGPYGHAEKIFVQKGRPEYLRAKAWWGSDVVSVIDPDSSTVDIVGTGLQAMLAECRQVPELTFLALEYGTVPMNDVFLALRGRSDWRRVGQECVSRCRSWWWPSD